VTDLDTSYDEKLITKASHTKFLGIYVESVLSWKIHIEQIIHKLSAACYTMRSVKPFMSQEILEMVYYVYFHSIVNYGIIFCGNSPHRVTFLTYKRILLELLPDAAFNKKKTLFTSRLDLHLRKKLVQCYMWSIALYGAETLKSLKCGAGEG
jgi:hypothetical protein